MYELLWLSNYLPAFSFSNPINFYDLNGAAVYLCSRELGDSGQPPTGHLRPHRHDYLFITTDPDLTVGLQAGGNSASDIWSSDGRIQWGGEFFNLDCTIICHDDRFDKYVQAEAGYSNYIGIKYMVAAHPAYTPIGTAAYLCGARNCQSWAADIIAMAKKEYLKNEKCPCKFNR